MQPRPPSASTINDIVARNTLWIAVVIWIIAIALGVAMFFVTKDSIDQSTGNKFNNVVLEFASVANRQFNFNTHSLQRVGTLFYLDAASLDEGVELIPPSKQNPVPNEPFSWQSTFDFEQRTRLNTSVSPSAFHKVTDLFLSQEPSLRSLEWVPHVVDDEARKLWTQLTVEYYNLNDSIGFTTEGSGGEVLPDSQKKPPYYPRAYINPQQGNEKALLFDMTTDDDRKELLERAAKSGATSCSGLIELLRGGIGLLITQPVFTNSSIRVNSLSDQRLRGFVLATLVVQEMLNVVLSVSLARYPMLWVGVIDPLTGNYIYSAGLGNNPVTRRIPKHRSWWATRSKSVNIFFADRTFTLIVVEVDPLASESLRNQPFVSMSVTVFVLALIGCMMLIWGALHRRRQQQLQFSIKTLQDFTAMTTHDLRTPVSAFQLTLHLLKQTQLSSEQRGLLESQEAARMAMQHVIDNVLVCEQYSKGKAEKLRPHESHVDVVGKVEDVVRMTTMYYLDEGHVNVDVRTHFARMVGWRFGIGSSSVSSSHSSSVSPRLNRLPVLPTNRLSGRRPDDLHTDVSSVSSGPLLVNGPTNEELKNSAVSSLCVHFDERYLQQVQSFGIRYFYHFTNSFICGCGCCCCCHCCLFLLA
jgi:CHASE1-domain containing sensor protein